MNITSPVDGALMMAARGVAQILLVPRGKAPITDSSGWPSDTTNTILTTNPDIIRAHNGNFGSGALAKVGSPCFFEIDTQEVLERIIAGTEHDLATDVQFIVKSRKNRGHFYFTHTEKSVALGNVSQSYVKYGDWSFRSNGQYVVTTGSINPVSGEPYQLIKAGEIIPIPDWFVDWMVSQKTSGTKVAKDEVLPRDENNLIIHGYFHGFLTTQAGKLRNMGLGGNTLEQALLDIAHQNLAPPIDDDKVRQVAHSFEKYPVGSAPLHDLILNMESDALTESEPTDEFHLVALEPPKNGNATLLIFSTIEDAKIATRLGFNATAVINGEGMVPISASITAVKMAYERVVLFGNDKTMEKLKPMLTPGSVVSEFPAEGAFDYESLLDLKNAKDEPAVTGYLNEQLRKPELLKTSLLQNPDTYKERTKGMLSAALHAIDTTADPRIIVRSSVENLKTLLLKSGNFPPPLTSVSLHGLLGEFVEIAHPTTAACRELLIGSIIPIIGAMFGKTNPCTFGSDVHPGATFYLNIARTADGKGQALSHAINALTLLDPMWATNNIHTGVASGEGLIRLAGGKELALAESDGKRLAIAIPEMSACFTSQNRDGSLLSDMIRNSWDGIKLQNSRSDVKRSTIAVNYTLGITGFITPDLLREVLPAMDWKNGSVNRFLWNVLSETKKVGRSPGIPKFHNWANDVNKLYALNRDAKNSAVIKYPADGAKVWDAWVDILPEYDDADPMLDGMARAKPHALRLANLYAQLDQRRLIGWELQLEPVHINAAIEHVEHSRASMQWYLDENKTLGTNQRGFDSQDIRKLRKMVASAIEEKGAAVLTASEIYKAFSHMTSEQRTEMCFDAGMVPTKSEAGSRGNKATVWTMVNPKLA